MSHKLTKKHRSTTMMIKSILSSVPGFEEYTVYKKPYTNLDPQSTKPMDIQDIHQVYTSLASNPSLNALFESHKLGIFARKPNDKVYIYVPSSDALNGLSSYDLSKDYEDRALNKLGVKYVIAVAKMPDRVNDTLITCSESTVLNSGSFGSVELCTTKPVVRQAAKQRTAEQKFIVKYMIRAHDFAAAQHEIAMMRKLQGHPNFVHVYPHIKLTNPSSQLYIVQEYCNLGDLFDFIDNLHTEKPIRTMQEMYSKMITNLFSDIYSAVKYIHGKQLIHGDIKPENIFVSSVSGNRDELDKVVFKLGDLGGIHDSGQVTKVHTARYAPGVRHLLSAYFIDYYGLALTLYSAITLSLPPKDKFYADGAYIPLLDIYIQLLSTNAKFKNHLTIECQDLIQALFFLLNNVERTLLENPGDDDAESFDMPEYVALFRHFAPLNNYKYMAAKLKNNNSIISKSGRKSGNHHYSSLKRRGINLVENGNLLNNSYV